MGAVESVSTTILLHYNFDSRLCRLFLTLHNPVNLCWVSGNITGNRFSPVLLLLLSLHTSFIVVFQAPLLGQSMAYFVGHGLGLKMLLRFPPIDSQKCT